MSARVAVLFAHPALQKSRVNRRLVRGLNAIEGVDFCDLYEEYPLMEIDVRREQARLEAADVIVWQHPFYWYSTPAILKQYQDLVLEHGWAYGRGGNALRGKTLLSVTTAGGSVSVYQPDGQNRLTIREFLAPIEQAALLCGMRYLAPFVVHGTHVLSLEDIEVHREAYHRLLVALRDERVDLDATAEMSHINADLDLVIRSV